MRDLISVLKFPMQVTTTELESWYMGKIGPVNGLEVVPTQPWEQGWLARETAASPKIGEVGRIS